MAAGEGAARAAEPPERRVRIDSFTALESALRHPDVEVRHTVLRAVGAAPAAALAFQGDGRDVIDALLVLVGETRGAPEHRLVVSTLLRFEDPRVTSLALDVFGNGRDERLALVAAARLARLEPEARVEHLAPIVMRDDQPTRVRAAANLLADIVSGAQPENAVTVEVALRVALVSDHDLSPPALTASSADAWQRALSGPWQRRARAALEREPAEALDPLWSLWSDGDATLRRWLLDVAARAPSAAALGRVRQLLDAATSAERDDPETLCAALRVLRTLQRDAEHPHRPDTAATDPVGDARRLSACCTHQSPHVRAAAIDAGAEIDDVPRAIRSEVDPIVRCALIERLGPTSDDAALEALLEALDDDAWQVRSRAASALARGATLDACPERSPVRDALVEVLANGSERAQVAAAQALQQLQVAGADASA